VHKIAIGTETKPDAELDQLLAHFTVANTSSDHSMLGRRPQKLMAVGRWPPSPHGIEGSTKDWRQSCQSHCTAGPETKFVDATCVSNTCAANEEQETLFRRSRLQ